MSIDLPLHHIGVATKSIAKDLVNFERLGYSACSEIFTDSAQKIRGLFVAAPGQPTLELLENLEPSGPLDSYLKAGTKFYHFAYTSYDIEQDYARILQDSRIKVITPVMPASFFKKVCFLMLPGMILIELVQL